MCSWVKLDWLMAETGWTAGGAGWGAGVDAGGGDAASSD